MIRDSTRPLDLPTSKRPYRSAETRGVNQNSDNGHQFSLTYFDKNSNPSLSDTAPIKLFK